MKRKPWNYPITPYTAVCILRDAVSDVSVVNSAYEQGIAESIVRAIRGDFANKVRKLKTMTPLDREEGYALLKNHFEARARL